MSKSKLSKYAPLIAAASAAGFGGIAGYCVFNQFQEGEKDAAKDDKKDGSKLSQQTEVTDPRELTELTDENSVPSKFPTQKIPPSAGIALKDAEPGKVLSPPVGKQIDDNFVQNKLPKIPLPQVPPPAGAPDKDRVCLIP